MTDMDKIPAERIIATGDGWLIEREDGELNVYLEDGDGWGTLVAYAWWAPSGELRVVLGEIPPRYEESNATAFLAAMSALRDAVQPKAVAA